MVLCSTGAAHARTSTAKVCIVVRCRAKKIPSSKVERVEARGGSKRNVLLLFLRLTGLPRFWRLVANPLKGKRRDESEDEKIPFTKACGVLPSVPIFVRPLECDIEHRPFFGLLAPDACAHGSVADTVDRLLNRFVISCTIFHIVGCWLTWTLAWPAILKLEMHFQSAIDGQFRCSSYQLFPSTKDPENCHFWQLSIHSGIAGKTATFGIFRGLPGASPRFYASCMTRRLRNWTYRDVTDFLKENGFSFTKELGGSHQAWEALEKEDKPARRVEVTFRHNSYPVGTLKTMIQQSGISEKRWIEWANS